MSVSFFTKTWEGDFARMLAGGFQKKWQACGYDFDEVNILLNNQVARMAFPGADKSICVADLESEVRSRYGNPDFKGGDVYSLAELVACHLCDTEYLCYVQGDCLPARGDWVTPAIEILESFPEIAVVSPSSDVNTWHDAEGLDRFFSDQAWLVRAKDFKDPHLMDGGPDIPEYPPHGGDSFEKKVAQWLRKNGKYRKILTNHRYEHPAY